MTLWYNRHSVHSVSYKSLLKTWSTIIHFKPGLKQKSQLLMDAEETFLNCTPCTFLFHCAFVEKCCASVLVCVNVFHNVFNKLGMSISFAVWVVV